MTDQTPSTEDDLLETINDYAHDFDRGGHLTLNDVKHALATRDAAHDREVAAKALRDAADEIDQVYFGPDQHVPFSTGAKHKWGATQAAARLRDRAASIEAGDE